MTKIVTFGEILVEIMADEAGDGFGAPMALTGPFPSGAPAIFISQVARMGVAAAMVSCVGNDDFGRLNIARLEADGVDVSAIGVHEDRPTGSAFVRYRPDGNRDFVFNIAHSASGAIGAGPASDRVFESATHLHVVGTSLITPALRQMAVDQGQAVKARGGTVSFDPNLRAEIENQPGLAEAIGAVLGLTDVFLPSGDEIYLGTDAGTPEDAMAVHLARGTRCVVHKRGSDGAVYGDSDTRLHQPPFPAMEVDPTGAGDCFGGAFVAAWLSGQPVAEALRLAAAAGALAVGKRGPMSGAEPRAVVEALVREGKDRA